MALYHNAAKRALRDNGLALGFGLHHLRSNSAPMLAAAGGHDHVFIDMEHGAFTMQEATQICIACLPHGIAPIVRVCAGALDEATRLSTTARLGLWCRMSIRRTMRGGSPMHSTTRRRARAVGVGRRRLMAICRPMSPRHRPRSMPKS
jgi:hypothetical protein